ncbi:glycosyltransferase [Alphaproteobacteria bacterium]|nr:glycosyltransferase [Alphaproteobacteria bacterium]
MKIKIGLLGNMNNNNYSFLRYLRDENFDVELLIFNNNPKIFDYKNDTYENKYKEYIKYLSWGSYEKFIFTSKKQIYEDIKKYDFLIGCGLAPAYLLKINKKLNIFYPYGADIDYFTSFNITYPWKIIQLWIAVYFQKKGIKNSKIIHLEYLGNKFDNKWKKFIENSIHWSFPGAHIYYKEYTKENILNYYKNSKIYYDLQDIRNKSDLILVSPSRHVWGGNLSDSNQKGTDILLHGIKLFKEENPKIDFTLIMFNRGPNFKQSLSLINKLNLNKNIIIYDELPRKKLMLILQFSDIVCGEFIHSWRSGGVFYEALLSKRILMTFRDEKKYNNIYPILNARTASQINKKISYYYNNKNIIFNKCEEAFVWFKENVINQSLEKYSKLFNDEQSKL